MLTVSTYSVTETQSIAKQLGVLVEAGDVILLFGDLGAGKTTFIQGLAEGLAICEDVTSPTYTLIQEYLDGRVPLYHFDPYRLSGAEDVADLGFEEYLERGGVVVVEWAERLGWLTPETYLRVAIELEWNGVRHINVSSFGDRYVNLSSELERAL